MDIGTALHEARERRGLTLHQVSGSTKISVTILEHIEHNEFDRLPGSVFTKGHLHAFAASVGIEDRPLLQEFDLRAAPVAVTKAAPARTRVNVEPERRFVLPGIAALVAVAALYLAFVMIRAANTAPPPADAQAAPTADVTAASLPATPAQAWPVRLDMQFSGDCWVSATADGQTVAYQLARAGEHLSMSADDEIVLRIGDPTVFAYRLNGVTGRPVGRPGAPATIRINRDTYGALLPDVAPPNVSQ